MRCSQCGLPLSPKRRSSNCPRCGSPINLNTGDQSAPFPNAFASGNLPNEQIPPVYPYTNINQSNPAVPAASNVYTPPTPNWHDGSNFQSPDVPQVPFAMNQPPQVAFPTPEDWQRTPPSNPGQQANIQQAAWSPNPSSAPYQAMQNRPGQSFAHNPYSPHSPYPPTKRRSQTTRIGFTIAALCIIAGGFLLIFVYFIGQEVLPGSGTAANSGITLQSTTTPKSQTQVPTTTVVSTATISPATPTPTLPGQNLLDTSVLASNFNEQTGQIIQQSTTFQVDQKVYVVFALHPGGNSHTVCLNWYLNDQSVNTFSFQVNPASNYSYYSYTMMHTAGNGRVDISLSSTTDCTGATMAKQLTFTIA